VVSQPLRFLLFYSIEFKKGVFIVRVQEVETFDLLAKLLDATSHLALPSNYRVEYFFFKAILDILEFLFRLFED
jgi:hypothetical protein